MLVPGYGSFRRFAAAVFVVLGLVLITLLDRPQRAQAQGSASDRLSPKNPADRSIAKNIRKMIDEGRQTFRFATFGDEAFWGDTLGLHKTIEGAANGGLGPGLSPSAALSLGLKVDVDALPESLIQDLKKGRVNLNDPAVTLALLKLNAVLGVTGFFNSGGTLNAVGIQCALCHSRVDDSLASGIGRRLDGWPNRDLNVGAIIAFAPDVSAIANLLGTNQTTVRNVLNGWGVGKFDAELLLDGKAAGPNGSSATLIPPAFNLAGVNLHTWTGWGSVTHWNAFVATLEMHGKGRFWDPRLNDATQFPIAAQNGFGNLNSQLSPDDDQVTSKLAALHFYQLAIPAPAPPADSFDSAAAKRGDMLFSGKARCNSCHVEPLWTEPGWNLHTASEIGIDDFQANRAPDHRYRTSPLAALWTHTKGGFYHDGRFATLLDVVNHYDGFMNLGLTAQEKSDLVEYLKSLPSQD